MDNNQKIRQHRRHDRHDNSDMIIICLSDGPKSVEEIDWNFITLSRRFGFFVELVDNAAIERGDLTQELLLDLDKMLQEGWVERVGDQYKLTSIGQEKAHERLEGLQKAGMLFRNLLQPETVSKVSLVVHFVLAAIKLPAGLISGSVGLINDAADTLLDGFSSLLVYIGFRLNKEKAVNIVLVLLMLITGGLTAYKAIQRFFIPFEPAVDWFAFLAAILSALLCLLLWNYQRYVGLKSGSVALITQSIDSRNHVIVAVSVTAGLITSLLRFSLLDTLVGLVVAILILKSAVELAIETIRNLGEEKPDISRYKMGLLERYRQFQHEQLRDWMLYLVGNQKVLTLTELKARAHEAYDFSDNPALRGFGLAKKGGVGGLIESGLKELYEKGWLEGKERLRMTEAGKQRLVHLMRRNRGERYRPSAKR